MSLPRPAVRRVSRRATMVAAAMAIAFTGLGSPPAAGRVEPVAPRGFVEISQVAPTIAHDVRYQTYHNFVGRPIKGYRQPLCLLSGPAADGLRRAQSEALRRGYSLKVYDCYRPQRAVSDFVEWAKNTDHSMKREFYPRVDKSVLFKDGYIADKSGHSRGSTMDLTLVKIPARIQPPYIRGQRLVPCYEPVKKRFPDNTIDMGVGFDCFDTLSHTLDPRVTGQPRQNRLLLKGIMERAGFVNYDYEWWHFTLKNEPYPNRYFDFPVAWSSVRH